MGIDGGFCARIFGHLVSMAIAVPGSYDNAMEFLFE